MEKKDTIYLENQYIAILEKIRFARSKEELEAAKESLKLFKENGLAGNLNNEVIDQFDDLTENEFYDVYDSRCFKKFAEKNSENMDQVLTNQLHEKQEAASEIERIKRKKTFRQFRRCLVAGLLVGGLIFGIASCNNKKKNNATSTTTTSETTTDMTTTTEETTISTGDYTPKTSETSNSSFDDSKAVPSMSNAMTGISIDGQGNTTSETTTEETTKKSTNSPEPTTTTTHSNNKSGNNGNGGSNGGSNNKGSDTTKSTTKPSSTTTTKQTEPTTTTTKDGDTVPTTSSVKTTNPSNDKNKRDVTVDEHDGKNPTHIDEDPKQTYPTYTTFETSSKSTTKPSSTTTTKQTKPTTTTTKTTTATTTAKPTPKPTTKQTVKGMPVEEDPTQTYETFFNPKKLSLRK